MPLTREQDRLRKRKERGKVKLREQQIMLANARFLQKDKLVPEPILKSVRNPDGTVTTTRLVPLSSEEQERIIKEHKAIKQKQYREKVLARRKRMYALVMEQKRKAENDTKTD